MDCPRCPAAFRPGIPSPAARRNGARPAPSPQIQQPPAFSMPPGSRKAMPHAFPHAPDMNLIPRTAGHIRCAAPISGFGNAANRPSRPCVSDGRAAVPAEMRLEGTLSRGSGDARAHVPFPNGHPGCKRWYGPPACTSSAATSETGKNGATRRLTVLPPPRAWEQWASPATAHGSGCVSNASKTMTPFPVAPPMQRLGNQVAEPALGHRVLVEEKQSLKKESPDPRRAFQGIGQNPETKSLASRAATGALKQSHMGAGPRT